MEKELGVERIFNLCHQRTDLNLEDVHIICNMAEHLEDFQGDMPCDLFIKVPTRINSEYLVIAELLKEDTGYPFSMVGYIIRETDEPAVARTLSLGESTYGIEANVITKEPGVTYQYVEPIKNGSRTIGGIVREEVDCDKHRGAQEEQAQVLTLSERIKKYPYLSNVNWFGDCVTDAMLVVNNNQKVVYINRQGLDLYNYYGYFGPIVGEEFGGVLLQGPIDVVSPNSPRYVEREVHARGRLLRMRQHRCSAEGHEFFVVILQDVSELKKSENLLNVKSAAVREIQHRVKNNLYTIYNLLDMQCRRSQSEEVKNTLQVTMNRILNIATPYDILLRRENNLVGLFDVAMQVSKNFQMMCQSEQNIRAHIEDMPLEVSLDIATNLSLILNELFQNCYKHAFVGRKEGNIWVTFSDEIINLRITVRDDGVGCDEQKLREDGSSLGLKVVKDIAKNQLDGRIGFSSDSNGTAVSVVFRAPTDLTIVKGAL